MLFSNLNIFKTLKLNFSQYPAIDALKFPILIFGSVELKILGDIEFEIIRFGVLKLGYRGSELELGCTSDVGQMQIDKGGKIKINGTSGFVWLTPGYKIFVRSNRTLNLDTSIYIGPNSRLVCSDSITIKEGFSSGWNLQILDSDAHYSVNTVTLEIQNNKLPIHLNEKVWCGNNVTLMKGCKIGEGSIVASKSLVNRDFCNDCNVILAGTPARIVKQNFTRFWFGEDYLNNYFYLNPDRKINSTDIRH